MVEREQSWNLAFAWEEQSQGKNTVVIITPPPSSHPMVTNNDHGYGSNVIWNHTSRAKYSLCIGGYLQRDLRGPLIPSPSAAQIFYHSKPAGESASFCLDTSAKKELFTS